MKISHLSLTQSQMNDKFKNTIYVISNPCLGDIFKIGNSGYLPNRVDSYTTYYPTKSKVVCWYRIRGYPCNRLDDDIKFAFDSKRLKEGGGTEFYRRLTSADLEMYFERRHISYEKHDDTTDFPRKVFKADKKPVARDILYGDTSVYSKQQLTDHQFQVLEETIGYFKTSTRGILNLFCRYGKTRLSSLFAQRMNFSRVLILVPSKYLVDQTYTEWKTHFKFFNIVKVYSDNQKIPYDTAGECVVISTYQSSYKLKDVKFDLCIYDEAHRTAGRNATSSFKSLLKSQDINFKLFLTATLKLYDGDADEYISTDDTDVYGNVIHTVSCAKALEIKRVCPYKILSIDMKGAGDYQEIAKGLVDSMEKYKIKHVITYHNSLESARNFSDILIALAPTISTQYIDGTMKSTDRKRIIRLFNEAESSVLCSSKVLQEGVDLPKCDGVIFVDPKISVIDITQSLARCLTYREDKTAYIMFPFEDTEVIKESGSLQDLRNILRILVELDDNVSAFFKNIGNSGVPTDSQTICTLLQKYGVLISMSLVKNIQDIAYCPIKVVKAKIKGMYQDEIEYASRVVSDFGSDIPLYPEAVYRRFGWHGWGDYLGLQDFMSLPNIKRRIQRINEKRIQEGKQMIETREQYIEFAKKTHMRTDIKVDNWCEFLLPNYRQLTEKYYSSKKDISDSLKSLGVSTIREYEKKCNQDPRLPPYRYIRCGFYASTISELQNFSKFIADLEDDTLF